MNHCSEKCLGFKGNHGGCCQLDDRDFIIGPVSDPAAFLQRVQNKFSGVKIEWKDSRKIKYLNIQEVKKVESIH